MDLSTTSWFFTGTVAVTAAVFVSLAIVSLRSGLRAVHHKLWILVCSGMASQMTVIAAASFLRSEAQAETAYRLSMSLGAFNQFLFPSFVLAFTEHRAGRRALTLVSAALGTAIVLLLWLTDTIIADVTTTKLSGFAPIAGSLAPLFLLYIALTWLASLILLVLAYGRSAGLRRTQTSYLLDAYVFGLLGSSGFMLTTMTEEFGLLLLFSAVLLVLFPFTITYAVIRHRLLGIRTIMHLTAVWGVLSVTMLLPLFGILWGAASLDLEMGAWQKAVLLMGLFAFAYGYIRVLKPRLDHVFMRGRVDREKAIVGFEKSMSALGRPEEVGGRILETLRSTLFPEKVSVVFRPIEGGWKVVGEPEGAIEPEKLDMAGLFVWRLAEVGAAVERSMVAVDERFEKVVGEAEEHFAAAGAQVCLPLVRKGEIIGIVHLGEKRNLRAYTTEDLEFLDRLGATAAIGMANAILFEQVDAQRRELEDLARGLEDKVRERTEELEDANERLKDLDRAKSRFFANISHELRTPLTLILVPIEAMLEAGDVGEEQEKQIRAIQMCALELFKLINDILDLSKLEDSQLKLRVERVDLGGLIGRIVDYSRPLAERKKIGLAYRAKARPVVEADGEKLERVVVNLLTNAFKFTEDGGRVEVRLDERGSMAVVTVEDTGIGIPAEELDRVFDRFHQVDDITLRMRGGTGIGLALVKEFVELHMGKVGVDSRPGRGSRFTVEIPLSAKDLPAERIDRRTERIPVPHRRREEDLGLPEWSDGILASKEYRFLGLNRATERRIVPRDETGRPLSAKLVVVDDNPDMLRYLHGILGKRYNVMVVQDGARAWDLVQRERPDLVVSDVSMPEVSGLELCARIKTDPRLQDTPVVLLTARGGADHRIEGHGAGADGYIEKPFEVRELLASVDGLLRGRTRRVESAARRQTATIETLLAGMAHELRNAAHQVSSAHAVMRELSQEAAAGGDPGRRADLEARIGKMSGVTKRALERITKVVHGLQQYSTGQVRAPWSDVAIDDLVAGEVRLLTAADDREVSIELRLASGASVRGPAEGIRQMVMNIVENAVQAVGARGRVRVSTEATQGKVRLTVQDDGCGIAADAIERVFDPFFTTKEPGQGMGLGLALCRKTASEMGGTIGIESTPGAGTRVVVEVPAARRDGSGGGIGA